MNHRTHPVRDDSGQIEIHDGSVYFCCEDRDFEASMPINKYTGDPPRILNRGAGANGIRHAWSIGPGMLSKEVLEAHGVGWIPVGLIQWGTEEVER
jgi:hypothetical protein